MNSVNLTQQGSDLCFEADVKSHAGVALRLRDSIEHLEAELASMVVVHRFLCIPHELLGAAKVTSSGQHTQLFHNFALKLDPFLLLCTFGTSFPNEVLNVTQMLLCLGKVSKRLLNPECVRLIEAHDVVEAMLGSGQAQIAVEAVVGW
eukprot:CAMPEP_0185574184 /NCGR_PEP_ID=MMETSP0434-20130131/5722_1 /TAXON_ID=626734 ORGANISM="Favella taraikaensis, Strain Fe Narragansett Bay" /NCGR_SAMPLE_ID=MMETSP0434 /ASSEMBLY_ACC=CAM_ASM_000379 /LENGTH=147 /DNA_ID=CAMNT_0028190681 /DNA_START=626 /DNA_END=1066 /DNA_ORIENTATION=-